MLHRAIWIGADRVDVALLMSNRTMVANLGNSYVNRRSLYSLSDSGPYLVTVSIPLPLTPQVRGTGIPTSKGIMALGTTVIMFD